jgi:hypothetical protein
LNTRKLGKAPTSGKVLRRREALVSRHAPLATRYIAVLVAVLFAGGCGDTLISISTDGRIEIAVTGDGLELGRLRVSVDGGAERALGGTGTVALTGVREGFHTVRLVGMPGECRVQGSNPRAVTVSTPGPTAVGFLVRC